MRQKQLSQWTPIIFVMGLTILLIAAAWTVSRLPFEIAYLARTENGIFEKLTIVFYGLAIVLSLRIAIGKRCRHGIYGSILMLYMGLREMDFHDRFDFTLLGLLAEIPMLKKLIFALILVFVIWALLKFLKGILPTPREYLHLRHPWVLPLAAIPMFVAISVIIDKNLNTGIIDYAIEITEMHRWVLFFSLLEECFEMGIPILFCATLIMWEKSPMAMKRS